MNVELRWAQRFPGVLSRSRDSGVLLWTVLLCGHLLPVLGGATFYPDSGFGDVQLYHEWMQRGISGGGWPVVDYSWVYPVGATLPMMVFGAVQAETAYVLLWVLMTFGLNLVVLGVIESRPGHNRAAAWWWVGSIALLGPVALSRLESVMVPVSVLALLALAKRPPLAAALLTFAGWIKIVPMVWLPIVLLLHPAKRARSLLAGCAVSCVIVASVCVLGGATRMFSFLTVQSDRGLQIESVPATVLQTSRLFGGGPEPTFSSQLVTFQFEGRIADLLSHFFTLLLVPAVVAVTVLGRRALRAKPERALEIVACTVLAATLCLIVFNKVGSPQYLAWPTAAVVLGLMVRDAAERHWMRWTGVLLILDLMTQLIYPHFYVQLIEGNPALVLTLVVRNLLLVALLVMTVQRLVLAGEQGNRRGGVTSPVSDPSGDPASTIQAAT